MNEDRYNIISSINFRPELFTKNKKDGWIEIIRKVDIEQRLSNKEEKCIVIIATGWANGGTFITGDKKKYVTKFDIFI